MRTSKTSKRVTKRASKTVKTTKTSKATMGTPANRLSMNVTGPQKFSDIDVPDILRTTVATGWNEVDALFTGTGIRPSTVTLVTGLPGAGKTTINLQLADKLAALGHTVLYNSCEESGQQLKMKLEKLELNDMIEKGYHASLTEIGEILEQAEKLRAQTAEGKQFFLFIDSIQTVEKAHEGRGRKPSQQNQSTEAVWDITAWCKQTMAIATIIGQVTKDGEFEGKQTLKHAIDCHLHLHVDTDRKSDTHGKRVAEMEKNRWGTAGLYFTYEVDSSGIRFEG